MENSGGYVKDWVTYVWFFKDENVLQECTWIWVVYVWYMYGTWDQSPSKKAKVH